MIMECYRAENVPNGLIVPLCNPQKSAIVVGQLLPQLFSFPAGYSPSKLSCQLARSGNHPHLHDNGTIVLLVRTFGFVCANYHAPLVGGANVSPKDNQRITSCPLPYASSSGSTSGSTCGSGKTTKLDFRYIH
jgi:hypothetical protein